MKELNILVTSNILLLASLLLFRKNNVLPNKILAFIFLIPGLNFANNLLILFEYVYRFPYFYFLVQGTAVLFAPLVYYYILLLIGIKLGPVKLLFFVSGLLFCFNVGLGIRFAFDTEGSQLVYIQSVINGPYPVEQEIYSLLFFLLQLVYFTLGAKDIYLYGKHAKDALSNLQGTKYNYLIRFIALFWSLTFLTILLYATTDAVLVEYVFLPLVISVIYIFILYYAYHHNAIFTSETFESKMESGQQIQSFLEVNHRILEEQKYPDELPEIIVEYVNQHLVHKDKKLTLQTFAEQLNYPTYQISKAINQGLKTTFYDLINQKRVDDAKLLLAEMHEKNLSIEGVAYEVGFNSRTAFYRAFKKYTGEIPTDFVFPRM